MGFPQYIKDKSGTPKVILAHQKMYNDNHVSFVHLFAVKKMILHDKVVLFSYFGMLIDGRIIALTPGSVKDTLFNAYIRSGDNKVMNELVSIVIPCYNRKNTIISCLKSCLEQTYDNIEVIIVDDGSTDDTYTLFEHNDDKRVRFYRYETNRGACYARNLGIEKAKGELIAFQDSDDIWKCEKIQKQVELMNKTGVDLVFCGMTRINPEKGIKFYYPTNNLNNSCNPVELLLANNVISTQTILIRKNAIKNIRFDVSFRRFQDWDFALQVVLQGLKIMYLEDALVVSTLQMNSISNTIKTFDAYEHLMNKYDAEYERYPHSKSVMYMQMAQSVKRTDRNKALLYYKKSLKHKFNFKTFAKLILYKLYLWK